jgi:hypothetical protein
MAAVPAPTVSFTAQVPAFSRVCMRIVGVCFSPFGAFRCWRCRRFRCRFFPIYGAWIEFKEVCPVSYNISPSPPKTGSLKFLNYYFSVQKVPFCRYSDSFKNIWGRRFCKTKFQMILFTFSGSVPVYYSYRPRIPDNIGLCTGKDIVSYLPLSSPPTQKTIRKDVMLNR